MTDAYDDPVLAAFVARVGTLAHWEKWKRAREWHDHLEIYRAGHADCAAQGAKDREEDAEHCMCPACKDGDLHWNTCAVHNMPASPNGPCDCGGFTFRSHAQERYTWVRTNPDCLRHFGMEKPKDLDAYIDRQIIAARKDTK